MIPARLVPYFESNNSTSSFAIFHQYYTKFHAIIDFFLFLAEITTYFDNFVADIGSDADLLTAY